jgi:lambda repressor-like predicted transcriptional regulator
MVHPWMTGQIIVGAAATSGGTTTGSTTSSGNTPGMSGNMTGTAMNNTTTGVQAAPQPATTPTETAPTVQPEALSVQLQQNGVSLGSPSGTGGIEPTTVGGDLGTAWAAGIAVIAVMSGVGIWTAVRRR